MIIEYMPFLLSKPKISERDAHPASHPVLLVVSFCPFQSRPQLQAV